MRFALVGLGANKLRSALTTLGILIGVGSVILLVAVGNGSSKAIQANIDKLGTNTLTISHSGGGFGRGRAANGRGHRQGPHRRRRQGAGRRRPGAGRAECLAGGARRPKLLRTQGFPRPSRRSSAPTRATSRRPTTRSPSGTYFSNTTSPTARKVDRARHDRGDQPVRHHRPDRQADHGQRHAVHRRRSAAVQGIHRFPGRRRHGDRTADDGAAVVHRLRLAERDHRRGQERQGHQRRAVARSPRSSTPGTRSPARPAPTSASSTRPACSRPAPARPRPSPCCSARWPRSRCWSAASASPTSCW